jgi:hypothetical protein
MSTEPVDLAAVRALHHNWLNGDADESDEAADKLHLLVPAMADEIEKLRGIVMRVERFMIEAGRDDPRFDDERVELYREVRRVNKEVPDAT